jgi:hypothetical protein
MRFPTYCVRLSCSRLNSTPTGLRDDARGGRQETEGTLTIRLGEMGNRSLFATQVEHPNRNTQQGSQQLQRDARLKT